MSYKEAVSYVEYLKRASAVFTGPAETKIKYFTMSDIELVRAARLEPNLALNEAYARARPSMLNVYVAAADSGDFDLIRTATMGIGAILDKHPDSLAKRELESLLHHRDMTVRASAASNLATRGIRSDLITKNLKEYFARGGEPRFLLFIGRQILKIEGPVSLDLARQAAKNARPSRNSNLPRNEFTFLLAEFGDEASIKHTRKLAQMSGQQNHFMRLNALQALCRSRGAKELNTVEAALSGPGDVRTIAMHWLFYFGQKSSISKLRTAAKDPIPDVDNSQHYRLIPATMLDFANRMERGEHGPRPPDDYYRRGSFRAWGPGGQLGR